MPDNKVKLVQLSRTFFRQKARINGIKIDSCISTIRQTGKQTDSLEGKQTESFFFSSCWIVNWQLSEEYWQVTVMKYLHAAGEGSSISKSQAGFCPYRKSQMLCLDFTMRFKTDQSSVWLGKGARRDEETWFEQRVYWYDLQEEWMHVQRGH